MQPDKKLKESKLYNGEIDIFEVFCSTTTATFNLHKWFEGYKGSDTIGDRGNHKGDLNYKFNERYNLHREYHTYGFEWTDTEYRFYVDGNCYCVLYVDEANDFVKDPDVMGMEGFQDYHYVILNNFIFNNASSWAPAGTRLEDNETKVIEYSVDYIRLYQNKTTDKIIIFKEQ
jgi:hypothetical protein